MNPPIFVYDPGTLLIFRSVHDAVRYVEAQDVNKNVYTEAYDSFGLRLHLLVNSKGIVELEPIEEEPTGNDVLKYRLISWLEIIRGVSPDKFDNLRTDFSSMGLEELGQISLSFADR